MTRLLIAIAAVAAMANFAPAADKVEPGFTPIFNGKDLTGWEGEAPFWFVEDGALTGQTKTRVKHNTYMRYRGGKPADFELRLQFRILAGNSGVQFRSSERPDWDMAGYQADIDQPGRYTGIVYELNGRAIITQRGQKVVIDPDGTRHVTQIGDAKKLNAVIKKGDWNDYQIIAQGPRIVLKINGQVMSELIDNEKDKSARSGLLGFQLHAGPPMKVQYKNIRLKEFK